MKSKEGGLKKYLPVSGTIGIKILMWSKLQKSEYSGLKYWFYLSISMIVILSVNCKNNVILKNFILRGL